MCENPFRIKNKIEFTREMKVITILAAIVRVVHMHMYAIKAFLKGTRLQLKNPSSYF